MCTTVSFFHFFHPIFFKAGSLDWIKMTKNWLEFDQKNWQRWTLTSELDRNFTTTNINFWTWPKNWYSPINVHHCGNIYSIFGQVHHVNIRRCQVFGHYHQFLSYSSWFGQVNNPLFFIQFYFLPILFLKWSKTGPSQTNFTNLKVFWK